MVMLWCVGAVGTLPPALYAAVAPGTHCGCAGCRWPTHTDAHMDAHTSHTTCTTRALSLTHTSKFQRRLVLSRERERESCPSGYASGYMWPTPDPEGSPAEPVPAPFDVHTAESEHAIRRNLDCPPLSAHEGPRLCPTQPSTHRMLQVSCLGAGCGGLWGRRNRLRWWP